MVYIHHHLGLGDHIICNGLVRHLQKKYSEVSIFCYHHNYENVKQMFSDNTNIFIITVNSDHEVTQYIKSEKVDPSRYLRVGFENMWSFIPSLKFDQAFYKLAGVDFQIRFDEFYLPRDKEMEQIVYNELNPDNEPYIFLHEDVKRNFLINRAKISTNYKIIENNTKYNIFHMLKIFENAEEIHLMQSSIKDLINSIKMDKPKIFLHNYVRNYGEELNSIGLNKIIKIN